MSGPAFETTLATRRAPIVDASHFFRPFIGREAEIVNPFARQKGDKAAPVQA